MRPSFAIAGFVLAAAAPLVAAKGSLGFALGTKLADGSCKYQADYEADFDAIFSASGSKLVRGYSAADCNCAQYILPAAKAKGFQVVLGVWPDVDASFAADRKALSTYVHLYPEQVYGITVGSETLYRANFTDKQLLVKINAVKDDHPGIKNIGFADSWNKIADGSADNLIKPEGNVTFILANAFAYWQGATAGKEAIYTYFDDIQKALARVQMISGSMDKVEFWNGESGWPADGGSDFGAAKAGTSLAADYYKKAVCGLLDWGVNAFYFEAFDE
jgi:glucan 1,3-beta-glucosidase